MFIHRTFSLAVLITGLSLFPGCSVVPTQAAKQQFHLGDRAPAGQITYMGLSAEYRDQIPGAKEPLKDRYLVMRLSATNGGAQEVTLPLTRLIAADGKEYPEVTEVEGFPEWLGPLRRIEPGKTEQGYIVFDVPVGAYKLEVSGGGDLEQEQLVQIDVPANLTPIAPSSVPGPVLGN